MSKQKLHKLGIYNMTIWKFSCPKKYVMCDLKNVVRKFKYLYLVSAVGRIYPGQSTYSRTM